MMFDPCTFFFSSVIASQFFITTKKTIILFYFIFILCHPSHVRGEDGGRRGVRLGSYFILSSLTGRTRLFYFILFYFTAQAPSVSTILLYDQLLYVIQLRTARINGKFVLFNYFLLKK